MQRSWSDRPSRGRAGRPALAGLPEDACLQAALPHVMSDGPLSLVSIGARGYAVLARSVDGRFQFLQNDKCSSGTGETMVKIASRFGLSIEEADRAALAADESIPITARCSVFAFRLRRDPPRTAGAATHVLPAGRRRGRDPSHRQRREARSGIS